MSHFGRSGPPDIRDTYSLLVLNITFRKFHLSSFLLTSFLLFLVLLLYLICLGQSPGVFAGFCSCWCYFQLPVLLRARAGPSSLLFPFVCFRRLSAAVLSSVV